MLGQTAGDAGLLCGGRINSLVHLQQFMLMEDTLGRTTTDERRYFYHDAVCHEPSRWQKDPSSRWDDRLDDDWQRGLRDTR